MDSFWGDIVSLYYNGTVKTSFYTGDAKDFALYQVGIKISVNPCLLSGLFYLNSLDWSISHIRVYLLTVLSTSFVKSFFAWHFAQKK